MLRLPRYLLVLFVGTSLVATGCQKLNKEMDADVDSGQWKSYTITPFQSDKEVTVHVTSEVPIMVVVIYGGEPDENTLLKNFGKGALASTEKPTQEVNLTAKVEAKKEFTVCVFSTKKTKVHLKITSN